MTAATTALLVGDDRQLVQVFRSTLDREPGVRLLVASDARECLALAREEHPDLVFADDRMSGGSVFDLCRRLMDAGATPTLVVITDPDGTAPGLSGLEGGVDQYLTRPIRPAELLARVRGVLRLKQLEGRLGAERLERQRLEQALDRTSAQSLALLEEIIDLGIPGARDRGKRIAETGLRLADRYGVPGELHRGLELAARLHELGRLVSGQADAAEWHYTQSTEAILEKMDGFTEAADLVGSVYENWDGTGFPEHRQRGQIPLRCRILRVLVDLHAALRRPGSPGPEGVLERLAEHCGTLYDPMVVVHTQALLRDGAEDDWRSTRLLLPITELREGMVLAEDLYTASGLKLVARNTTLTPTTLETILRRHRVEPIVHGAAVERS